MYECMYYTVHWTFLNKKKRIYFIYPQIMNWTVLAGLAAAEPNCTQKKWVHEQAQKNKTKKSSIRPNPMQNP